MKFSNVRAMDYGRFYILIALIMFSLTVTGCVPPKLASQGELEIWSKAGPVYSNAATLNSAIRATIPTGEYRLVSGDKISVSLEELMQTVEGPEHAQTNKIERRVRADGTISLPMLDDDIKVAGKTMLEVEEAIEKAYWPELVIKRPSIVVTVEDYASVAVDISGRGIATPGIYRLSSDTRCLSALLMLAGGINSDYGASKIIVTSADGANISEIPLDFDLGLSADVQLTGGERVFVEPMNSTSISVLGLVKSPGRYGMSPKAPPTLIELIAQAGGVREVEDPRYVTVYRKNADNQMISARVRINNDDGIGYANPLHDDELGSGAFAQLKADDIVIVESTLRTRMRQFIIRNVSLTAGASATTSASLHKDIEEAVQGSTTNVTNNNITNTGN